MPTPADSRAWVLAALDEFEVRLVRYALRLLGDESSARDAVQHAFLRLCDQSPHDHASGVAPWLFAVVRNRAMDLLRQRGRDQSLEGEHESAAATRVDDDPALLVERDDLLAMVRRVISQLPPLQGEAVALWSEGFSYAEMAEITGRGSGSLRVQVHRAIAQLRSHPAIEAATDEPRNLTSSNPPAV